MKRATSVDVAREAGVSQTTVSFVLNGRSDMGISESTRSQVLSVAKRLGYVPSASARSLKRGRSNIVLCALPTLPVARALEELKEDLSLQLGEAGYACVFVYSGAVTTPLADLLQFLQPDAVLAVGDLTEADRQALGLSAVPFIDGILSPRGPEATAFRQEAIGDLQVTRLVASGRDRIGYAGLSDPVEERFYLPRLDGARKACERLGIAPPVVATLEYTRESAQSALAVWTAGDTRVNGIAAFNDLAALAILAACRVAGVRVPGDVALIGVDDLELAALTSPALSTIRIDVAAATATIVAATLDLLGASSAPPEQPPSTIRFVQRESS
ncbi:LacI family transcriptional regulator [Frondihabitans sucicola]|uniref:LacI family transcriptional regulator n=1 Tax=Frondihabitans sucicola TaxID=1268041 RepID=A0ABN6Y1K6_9MICO|nr:LacI family DNA-binding transcriptional regulator [Frondihabitans sucicola]BDZ49598.1 LacI family transcriptional regulator [Frondihabitans sucicola]